MLHVAFRELPAGGIQDLRASQIRVVQEKRQRVLKLVPEAEGAARLVEGRPRPDTAGKALIGQPVIDHCVESPVGRLDLKRIEEAPPCRFVRGEPTFEVLRTVARDERACLLGRGGVAEQEDQRGLASGRNLDVAGKRGTRIGPRLDPARKRGRPTSPPAATPPCRRGR